MKKIEKLNFQQKKEGGLIAVLSLVALALLVFSVNAFKSEAPASQPSAPVTAATSSVQPATQAPQTTAAPVTETTAAATPAPAVVDETEEVLRVLTESMHKIKSSEANFKGHKVQNINLKLVDSSMPSMNDFVNSIISTFIKEEVYDYDFTNGVSVDPESGSESKSNSIFPPGDIEFSLKKEGIASAKIEKDGENTVYSVVLVAETSTLENPRPPHHNSAADTLDLSSIEIPVATITKADFEYPGATISVTLNPEGEICGYYEHLRINGTGEAKALGLTGFGTIEGYMEEKWDIEWK